MNEFDRHLDVLRALYTAATEAAPNVDEELHFQRNLAALGGFAIRPNEPFTCGSQLHAPRRNPYYRPIEGVAIVPPPRVPIGELIGKPGRNARPKVRPRARKTPPEPKQVEPVRYGHRDGRTAGGAIPPRRPEAP